MARTKINWQPISTAPRETEILVGRYREDGRFYYCRSGFYFDKGNDLEGERPYWYWHCDHDTDGVTDDPQYWAPDLEGPPGRPSGGFSRTSRCQPAGSCCPPPYGFR